MDLRAFEGSLEPLHGCQGFSSDSQGFCKFLEGYLRVRSGLGRMPGIPCRRIGSFGFY